MTPTRSGGAEVQGVGRSSRGDATPHLPERHEKLIRAFAVVTLGYTFYYIVWRWAETLNWDALWFSVPLALAETYIFLTALMLVFTVWRLERRDPPPAPEGLSVDVFITTFDESPEIIRSTAVSAREIRYPHRTYILDDGKRDVVRDLAAELGVGYIRREGNEHAKAGNLNNALSVTDGDFILQLDADHVPLAQILDRLLGFFRDPKVAFAQSPQDFYNTDAFSYDLSLERRRVWEEQRLFFSLLQPGKDRWNAAFFCGSCGVLRRTALEEIGGFSTNSITEDMETSMVLHARGWKSVYYGESLAYGLAPASAGQYHVQRLRWGQGSMQILRKMNPLTYPGLTWPQRICYFNSVSSYLDGLAKLVLYLAPIVFFATGVLPIAVDNREFLPRFIPYLALHLVMFEAIFRGTGFLLIAERYNMAKFWIYVKALSGFFARGNLKFNVTPKGQGEVPLRVYAPQLLLAVATASSVVWATLAYHFGWMEYTVPGWGSLAFWFNFGWAVYNFTFAAYVVYLSLRYKQQRSEERFAAVLPLRLRVRGPGEEDEHTVSAVTENLTTVGMGFRCTAPVEVGSAVRATLPLANGRVEVSGEVVHHEADPGRRGVHFHGLEFRDLSIEIRDVIDHHCSHYAVAMERLSLQQAFPPFERLVRWMSDARGASRHSVRLPVNVLEDGGGQTTQRMGFLAEVSSGGARLLLDEPVAPGARFCYEIPETPMRGEGEVVFVQALETPVGVVFSVGLRSVVWDGR